MERYTNANALYKRAAELEAQALDYVLKLNEKLPREMSETEKSEWVKWSVILAERTAFKFDVADAPSADVRENIHGEWISKETFFDDLNVFVCSNCRMRFATKDSRNWNYCPNCGAKMDGERGEDE